MRAASGSDTNRMAGRVEALGCVAAGLLGFLPGPRGPLDLVALLSWLVLIAVPAGVFVGGQGARLARAGLLVPTGWALFLLLGALAGPDASFPAVPQPAFGLFVVLGLHLAGFALGRWLHARRRPVSGAVAITLVAGLLLTGLPVRGALASETPPADLPDGLTRAVIELSPLVLVLESAGVDWTHAQPAMYARSGVERLPRKAYRGALAGPVLLVVGSLLVFLVSRLRSGH